MIKKITSLLFCVTLLFSLTACGPKVSDKALDALEKAIANIGEMKSADYTINVTSVIENKKQKMSLHGSYDVSTAQPLISAQLDLEQGDQKVDSYVGFYVDKENVYLNLMNLYKLKEPLTSITESDDMPFKVEKDTFKLPKSKMKKLLKKAELSGDTLTLEFDCDKLEAAMKEDKKTSDVKALETTKFKKITLVVKLEDAMICSADIQIEMESSEDDKIEHGNFNIKAAFKNINHVKTINFPDFSDYQENDGTIAPESLIKN